jgi:hypothetical protein
LDLIIITLVVFCLLVGIMIGFMAHSFPRLMLSLSALSDGVKITNEKLYAVATLLHRLDEEHLASIAIELQKQNETLKKLLNLQIAADNYGGALPPGVYQEDEKGNLVRMDRAGDNRTTLPGGLVAPPGITPSQIYR